jgi:glutathione S-transferase
MSPSWKLYGVPLSQPFRSVAWALLQNNIKFQSVLCVPGATTKVGSRNEEYVTRSKTGRVPLLEDTNDGFVVAESPAILSHLCECYGWGESLYGSPGSKKKATIDSYMHWHHHGTRNLARVAFPYLRPESNKSVNDHDRNRAWDALRALEDGWFAMNSASSFSSKHNDRGPFLAGFQEHSIADLLAYEEVVQLTALGLLHNLQKDYPKVHAWTKRMSQLPFHDEVHVSLYTLGDVTDAKNDTPFSKRLGTATKTGLRALATAQDDFEEDSSHKKHPTSKL